MQAHQGAQSAQAGSYPRLGSTPPLGRNSSSWGKRQSRPARRSDDYAPPGSSPLAGRSGSAQRHGRASTDSRPSSLSDDGGASLSSSATHYQPVTRSEGFTIKEESSVASSPESIRVMGEDYQQGPTRLSSALSRDLSRQLSDSLQQTESSAQKAQLERCLSSGSRLSVPDAAESKFRLLQDRHIVCRQLEFEQAYQLARQTLASQTSRKPASLMAHNLGTVAVLAELGANSACVSAALLHGVVDAGSSLLHNLPKEVAMHVTNAARIADTSQIINQHRGRTDEATMQQFSSMLLGIADIPALLVHLANRLQLMRSGTCKPEQAQEVLDIWAPLASQLGVWYIKAQLEDGAFKVLHPQEHAELEAALRRSNLTGSLRQEIDLLKARLNAKGITNVDLAGRSKNLYAVWKKMQTKGCDLEGLHDLRALRLVVRGPQGRAACYELLKEVHALWQPISGRFKNYIHQPKRNGYRSLHDVVTASDGLPMEIQIRSDKMHFINEYGVAAHWRYKEDNSRLNDHVRNCQVAFARSMIAWSLELKDNKTRPTGAAARDTALASLCPFPQHRPSCPAADTDAFLRFNAPRAEQKDEGPVYVIAVERDMDGASSRGPGRLAIRELPAACTLGQVDGLLALERAASQRSAPVKLLVNGQEAADDTIMAHGDKLEIVPTRPAVEPQLPRGFFDTALADSGLSECYSPRSLLRQTAALRAA